MPLPIRMALHTGRHGAGGRSGLIGINWADLIKGAAGKRQSIRRILLIGDHFLTSPPEVAE